VVVVVVLLLLLLFPACWHTLYWSPARLWLVSFDQVAHRPAICMENSVHKHHADTCVHERASCQGLQVDSALL
jgi:hypothetical protein